MNTVTAEVISFNYAVIDAAKDLGINRIGWVIKEWGEESYKLAQKLNPEFLFCNVKKIPDVDGSLWDGSWCWAIYDVVDPEIALRWITRGVNYIESWEVGGLLNQKSCISAINGIDND